MGTYVTTSALETVMIGTSFDTATTSLADKCIEWAEAEVNKYISERYAPFSTFTSVPPVIRSITEQLATGYMYINNARGGKDAFTRGNIYKKMAIEDLELIMKKKVSLVDTSGSLIDENEDTGNNVLCNTSDYHTTFDEDSPLNWSVDPNKLDDIEDGRDV